MIDFDEIFENKSEEANVYESSQGSFGNGGNTFVIAKDLLDEKSREDSVERKILEKPKYVYHGQFENVKFLTPKETDGTIFVTPYVGIASLFVVDLEIAREGFTKAKNQYKKGRDYGYTQWDYPPSKLVKPFKKIEIYVRNDPDFKEKTGTIEGYIYVIDYNKYRSAIKEIETEGKKQMLLFSKKVDYVKKYKITIEYIIKYKP